MALEISGYLLYSIKSDNTTTGDRIDRMDRSGFALIIAVGIGLAVAACGPRGGSRGETGPDDMLPERIDGTGWIRAAAFERFEGDSLFEYIDGAAEMYHKYDFVEVTVARYLRDEATITADLYLFEGTDNAFGMYTTLRPDEPDTVSLGVEGFVFGSNLVFAKGAHLVNVYTYDDFEGVLSDLRSVGAALEGRLPGTSTKPQMFSLFPGRDRVDFTEKIFAEGFLGHGFLTEVYTVDYSAGDGRLRLFLTPDPGSDKFERWCDAAGVGPDAASGWLGEAFVGAKALETVHDYHGEIIAVWRDGRLAGVVGYIPAYREPFMGWVESLD